MTQEQKDSLIVKMLSQPEMLTREETDAIVTDEDLCQIYSTAANLKAAYMQIKQFDADSEWSAFKHRLKPRRVRSRWYMRAAAIFAGVILASAIALTLMPGTDTESAPMIAENDTLHIIAPIMNLTQEQSLTENKTEVKAENKTSKTNKKNRKAKPKTLPRTRESKPLLAEEYNDIDIQQQIDLQQARIENEIAQRQAEMYMQQYYSMQRARNMQPEMPVVRTSYNENPPQNSCFMRVVMQ